MFAMHRTIEIQPAAFGEGLFFTIGHEDYCASTADEARAIIDYVIDNQSLTYRGVFAAPVWDGALSFEVGTRRFTVDGDSQKSRVFAAKAVIDAVLDRLH